MKRRLLALVLVLAMTLSLAPAVFAAEERDTDFFTPRDHADLDFADMEYEATDINEVNAQFDAVRALTADADNLDAVRAGLAEAVETYRMALTMATLAYIYSSQDYTDEAWTLRSQEADQTVERVWDALLLLIRDILRSPCAAAAEGIVAEEDREWIVDYEGRSEESLALSERVTELENRYFPLAGEVYTAEYGGKTWTEEAADAAYDADEIDFDTYWEISVEIARQRNAALGALYLELMDALREQALDHGYDSYADYAYGEVYLRDYSPQEIRQFHSAVKELLVPVYLELEELYISAPSSGMIYEDYTGDVALDIMDPYVAMLSGEMYESFRYMRDHGLYDSGWNEKKNNQGYTTTLVSYAAPFFFNSPVGGMTDLTTAIHEFGHYNNGYWMDDGWYAGDKSIDICEVHSQALELLFTRFYPEIFGGDSEAAEYYILVSLTNSIISGCLYDELQQYAFDTPGVTLRQLNEKYCQLAREYGLIDADDERTEMYGWVEVPHTFVAPFYYISYAVSAAGAYEFWMEWKNGEFYDAVDDYLRFTALDMNFGFQDSFLAVGLESPLTDSYLSSLAGTLEEEMANAGAMPYTDVTEDDWFYDYVDFVWSFGLMSGAGAAFAPDSPLTRAMAVASLYRLIGDEEGIVPDGSYTDVPEGSWYELPVYWAREYEIISESADGLFRPDEPVTREQYAAMIFRMLCAMDAVYEDEFAELSDWVDGGEVSDYAGDAMRWMVYNEIFTGRDGGLLAPREAATRAEGATILTNVLLYLLYTSLDYVEE